MQTVKDNGSSHVASLSQHQPLSPEACRSSTDDREEEPPPQNKNTYRDTLKWTRTHSLKVHTRKHSLIVRQERSSHSCAFEFPCRKSRAREEWGYRETSQTAHRLECKKKADRWTSSLRTQQQWAPLKTSTDSNHGAKGGNRQHYWLLIITPHLGCLRVWCNLRFEERCIPRQLTK